MGKNSTKKTAFRPKVKYRLTLVGGTKDGEIVYGDNKAAARGMFDALSLIADTVSIVKVVERECTRNEINAVSRPRAAKPAPAVASKK